MSITPFVSAWAKQFFAKGIGMPEFDESKFSEETISGEYKKNFEEPAKRFMGSNSLSWNDAAKFLTELKSNKLYSALYILPALNPVEAGTWQVSLRESIKQFTTTHTPYFGMFSGANTCIVCYVDDDKYEVVGAYPGLGTLYPLIPLNTKGVNGDAVTYLCRKDPVLMSEQEITATEYLVTCKAVNLEQLNTALFYMPSGDTKVVRATDLKDIPFCVRKLIKDLPPALAMEHNGNVYEAARAFAVKNPSEYVDELYWLDRMFHGNSAVAQGITELPKSGAVEINDDVVKSYLIEHYGMNPDLSLSALFSNPLQYLSSATMASAIKEQGIDEVMEAMHDNPEYMTGTLDEIITGYCKDEGIDTKCTISQLIHYINYECKITPPDMATVIGDYVSQNSTFNMETTVQEILTNTPHKHVDDFDACMEFIDGCDNIDGSVKRALRQALIDNTELKMPDSVGISDRNIIDAIESKNIPEECKQLIADIINGKVTELPKSTTDKNNSRVLSVREQATRDAAAHILNSFRDYLLTDDTDKKRLAGQSILYSYLKILYAGRSSVEEDKEFLLNKVSSCTDVGVKKILEEAIDIYSK